MREIACAILDEFKKCIPVIFDDIEKKNRGIWVKFFRNCVT